LEPALRIVSASLKRDMDHQAAPRSPASHRDRWLALLDWYGVGHPKALRITDIPGGMVQATGEPPGHISLEGAPGNVLMFNMSPVQGLRQTRDGRTFVSNMLHGDMTLLPRGIASQWSWNSNCDRLDVVVSNDALGEGSKLEVVDRFLFSRTGFSAAAGALLRGLRDAANC
jgi:hypothetical protein